jgi:hypothetical protein
MDEGKAHLMQALKNMKYMEKCASEGCSEMINKNHRSYPYCQSCYASDWKSKNE